MQRLLWFFIAALACGQFVKPQAPLRYTYKIIKSFSHDRYAFTQGLEFRDGNFFEGTGLNNRSSLRRVKPETGEVLQKIDILSRHFGEGITVFKDRILQLTWQDNTGFIYDRKTFKQTGTFKYPGEGWGLANDGKHVYMSDGSAAIRVWDATTLKELRRITVHNGNSVIDQINELEYVDGELFANVWQTDYILRISPTDGRVLGIIDLSGLLSPADAAGNQVDVLNGIAYDAPTKRLFVTGKLWPRIYQIEIIRTQ